MRKVVRFILPVEFEFENKAALAEAIRNFLKDPIYGCSSGEWSWRQKSPRRLKNKGGGLT